MPGPHWNDGNHMRHNPAIGRSVLLSVALVAAAVIVGWGIIPPGRHTVVTAPGRIPDPIIGNRFLRSTDEPRTERPSSGDRPVPLPNTLGEADPDLVPFPPLDALSVEHQFERIDGMLRVVEQIRNDFESLEAGYRELEERQRFIEYIAAAMALGRLELPNGPSSSHRLVLVYVPPGTFRMGRSDDERRLANLQSGGMHHDWSVPQHQVHVQAGYFIGIHEITNADYAVFAQSLRAGGSNIGGGPVDSPPDQPVTGVSWGDAVAFCDWLSRFSGLPVRLPTEIEWEFAARGPTSARFSGIDGSYFRNGRDSPGPKPVANAPADRSWCGAMDMSGNVQEWCWDAWDPDAYSHAVDTINSTGRTSLQHDPGRVLTVADSALRVVRGGSFRDSPANCEAPTRRYKLADDGHETVGFRIVIPMPLPRVDATSGEHARSDGSSG